MSIKKTSNAEAVVSTKKTKEGETTIKEETVPYKSDVALSDPAAKVGVKLSHTMNLGDFNSIKCEVWLEVECGKKEVNKAYKSVRTWVDGKLTEMVKEAQE